ncbi:oligopeptide ABC transporter ATP-binding protein OppF [Longimycelium tulufanense]|uniref:Oligopeptide ABC transporter ATP-binding protein OppF n=1 Tax=Longimycelium tulufanense TaxID=907463 RepID=A0A8J3C6M3_9PSEU|nr:dipeptide ABC transporter ATP-binding protein [Longimycelium tulufanense]GGM41941.1 oligopeptide ABC transporter ATP-binding protein OppF [Longimycelium tulufanense]
MTSAHSPLDPPKAAPGEPVLEVSDLEVSFPSEAGRVRAVRGLGYRVDPGEVLGIVGESGSGKSVSSLAVMGLLGAGARVSGSIRFRGRELLGLSDGELSRIRGRRIAMVFQDPLSALTPVYSVGDQVAEAVRTHAGVSRREAARRAVELLDLVGIPNAAERAGAFPHEFSGGMRQRVVIAMAIAHDPDLIIADEPTTALDVTVQAQVLDVLRTAREVTGAGIVLITHDLGVVAGVADRVLVMYAGRAVETGTVDQIFARPRMPYTLGLLGALPRVDEAEKRPLVPIDGQPPSLVQLPPGCSFAPRCPVSVPQCTLGEPALAPVDGGTGHRAACIRSDEIARSEAVPAEIYHVEPVRPAREPGPVQRASRVVLQVRDLVKHYPVSKGLLRRRAGLIRAVDGVTFDIRQGEAFGLVGESGCGKTSTLMEILGLRAPAAGTVRILGRDVVELDRRARRAVRRDLQVVFQDPMASLDPRMPVGAAVAEPMEVHGYPRERIRRRVPELLRLVGLGFEHADRYPVELSGGQRQRVCIARALALEPKLVVLDEPVSALDVSIQAGVINLLDELKDRLGLSYLFVAHDLSVVRHVADRVAVMYLGRIVEVGEAETVFGAALHPYTQALLSAVPVPDPVTERARERIVLTGDLPSPADPPSGCRFRTRCFLHAALSAEDRAVCATVDPPRKPRGDGADHEVACHFARPRKVL